MSTRVGVVGATGYAGQELVRLLTRHPQVELGLAMTSSTKEETRTLPTLTRVWDGALSPFSSDRLQTEIDVAFLALPDTASAELAQPLLDHGVRVFDLSGAFRLRDAEARQRWYPAAPDISPPAVYGLPERRRDRLVDARFVTCPGCYPTVTLLALEPLVESGVLKDDTDIFIDAKSGISGAGRKLQAHTQFSERHDNVTAYGIFSHRHGAEIEQELGRSVTFVPHFVPLHRGILATIFARVPSSVTTDDIEKAYARAYGDAPFVRLRGDSLPEVTHVAQTNFCDIGWKHDVGSGRLVIVACLDNLVKGAAGQAVQCLNVALGFDERDGLHP